MHFPWRSSFKGEVKWVLATGLGDVILLPFFCHATEKQSINELRLQQLVELYLDSKVSHTLGHAIVKDYTMLDRISLDDSLKLRTSLIFGQFCRARTRYFKRLWKA